MQKEVLSRLSKLVSKLESTRDELFDCSREFVVEGSNGRWHLAEELFSLAKSADEIRAHLASMLSASPLEFAGGSGASPVELVHPPTAPTKAPRKRKEDYPRFVVRNDSLIKVGLGRDRRTEYEHLVPKREYDKVVARLINISETSKEFTTEHVQAALDCPLYQTYTVLSLLKETELLTLPRRGHYSFASKKTFKFDVAAVWAKFEKA